MFLLPLQSLHLKITILDQFRNQWAPEELSILAEFIETKVLSAPYKPNSFSSIIRLLSTPIEVIKDGIQLMRMELVSCTRVLILLSL